MQPTTVCDFRAQLQHADNYGREITTKMEEQQQLVESLRKQVASLTSKLHQQRRQQARDRTRQRALMDRDALHQEVWELRDLLRKEKDNCVYERTGRIQLGQELEETRRQLAYQKHLKDTFIKKEKQTRKELEMVRKYTNKDTLSTTKIATQVRDRIKQKKKKLLQKDYEELKVAHIISQEKFETELQAEKQRNSLLNEELERIKFSYQEASRMSETVGKQAEFLQRRLEIEIQSRPDNVNDDLHLMRNLRAEQEVVRQMMAEELAVLQKDASVKEESFWREVEELKTQLATQTSLNLQLTAKLEAEREEHEPRRRKIARREQKPVEEEVYKQETETLSIVPALEPLEEAAVSEKLPEQNQNMSAWKRTRHFLGLRKPKKWKKQKQDESN